MNSFERRLAVTAAALAVVFAAQWIVVPGIPSVLKLELWRVPLGHRSLLGLGVGPYLAAAGFWLLLSGPFRRLRQLREGSPAERRGFDRGIVWLTLAVALIQAISVVMWLRAMPVSSDMVSLWSCVVLTVSLVGGTFLLLALALLIDRLGVGSGLALVAFTTIYLVPLPRGIALELARLESAGLGFSALPIALVGFAAVVWASDRYVDTRRDLSLVRSIPAGPEARAESTPLALPLRLNLIGVVPLTLAIATVGMLEVVRTLVPWPVMMNIPHAGLWRTIVDAILTIVLSYVYVSFAFDTARVQPMLERYGYRVAELPEGAALGDFLDRAIERRVLPAALCLIAIWIAPTVLGKLTQVDLGSVGLTGSFALIGCAVVRDTLRHARAVRLIEQAEAPLEAEHAHPPVGVAEAAVEEDDSPTGDGTDGTTGVEAIGWVEAVDVSTELEARLIAGLLQRDGIPTVIASNRVIPLLGTLAVWEWTPATFPSLVIHRRLGEGRVRVYVPWSVLSEARDRIEAVRPPGADEAGAEG